MGEILGGGGKNPRLKGDGEGADDEADVEEQVRGHARQGFITRRRVHRPYELNHVLGLFSSLHAAA